MNLGSSPHAGAQVLVQGVPLGQSSAAVILLHGRGGSARDILGLAQAFALDNVTYLAPEATGHTWYPNSFMAPITSNEPWLSSALALIDSLVRRCENAGLATSRVGITGFSQGACLATEYVARHPQKYGALIGFTGGLIGPPGASLHHDGNLSGTAILLSSGDPDPHVPWSRVEETASQLRSMGATVRLLHHPERPHTILNEEILAARNLLQGVWADL